jgi:hypothetical protein
MADQDILCSGHFTQQRVDGRLGLCLRRAAGALRRVSTDVDGQSATREQWVVFAGLPAGREDALRIAHRIIHGGRVVVGGRIATVGRRRTAAVRYRWTAAIGQKTISGSAAASR